MNFACSMVDSIFSRRFQVSNIFCVHPEPWGNDPIWRLYDVSIGLEKNHQLVFHLFLLLLEALKFLGSKPQATSSHEKLPGAGQWLLSGRTSGLKPSSSQFEAQLQPLKMGHNERNELMDGWMDELGGGFKYFFYVHPYLGKILILTNIFQRGWNHQPDEWTHEWTIFGFSMSKLVDRSPPPHKRNTQVYSRWVAWWKEFGGHSEIIKGIFRDPQ